MRAGTNKVLLPLLGKALIRYQLEALRGAGVERIILVVGFQADRVKAELGDEVEYVLQPEPKGTGQALLQARPRLLELGGDSDILVTVGDLPFLTSGLLSGLVRRHRETSAAATIVTAVLDPPPPYGRVLRDGQGKVLRVVEEFDATPEQKLIREVHVSIYALKAGAALPLLDEIRNDNAKGEFYLTDLIGILTSHGFKVGTFQSKDPRATLGINTPEDLAAAEAFLASGHG